MTALDKQARELLEKLCDEANAKFGSYDEYISESMEQYIADGILAFATQVREQTVQECAGIADHEGSNTYGNYRQGCEAVAYRIRALAAPPQTTEQEER